MQDRLQRAREKVENGIEEDEIEDDEDMDEFAEVLMRGINTSSKQNSI